MQDWDRIVMLIVGAGVGIYAGVAGWRSWKQQQRLAAVGDFLLAVTSAVMPILLAILGG